MCGIAAIVQTRPTTDARTLLHTKCEAIVHREPDGAGYAMFDEGRAALGCVRLSIRDIVDGDQHLFNEDRTIAVVCNSEIYDYDLHRAQQEKAQHRFRTRSDSEQVEAAALMTTFRFTPSLGETAGAAEETSIPTRAKLKTSRIVH